MQIKYRAPGGRATAVTALESQEGGWRPEEIAAEAAAADRFFLGRDATGRHVGCVWMTPLPARW